MKIKTDSLIHPPQFFILLLAIAFNAVTFGSDLEKEKRWADQVSDSLLDGEPVYLEAGSVKFLAIDTRAEEPNDIGVIVMHGIGIHPDWETVIQPLRVELTAAGWNTLSLQMPVLGNDATGADYEPLLKEVPPRIDAGIRYLFKNGSKKVILVAHSLGTRMTNYYLANKKIYQEAQTETPIIAYVAIGMGGAQFLKDIKIPILDLYGENDLPNVIASAKERAEASKHNKNYTQKMVAGATHFFEDQDDDLVKAVKSELLKYK